MADCVSGHATLPRNLGTLRLVQITRLHGGRTDLVLYGLSARSRRHDQVPKSHSWPTQHHLWRPTRDLLHLGEWTNYIISLTVYILLYMVAYHFIYLYASHLITEVKHIYYAERECLEKLDKLDFIHLRHLSANKEHCNRTSNLCQCKWHPLSLQDHWLFQFIWLIISFRLWWKPSLGLCEQNAVCH